MAPFFAELFPTRVRYSAMSASYQIASVAGGSLAPVIATLLLKETGMPLAVACYGCLMALPACACILWSRETKAVNLDALS
jgi:hypothetical protein